MIPWGDPAFSGVLAACYLGLISLMWLGLVLGVPRWGRGWELERPAASAADPADPADPADRVSICVPARDEVANIGACVRAALASRWADLEVIVVDDRSSDGTGDAALAAAGGDPRLRVVQGSEPPDRWAGKAWACVRASGEASGDVLIFVDADVQLDPDAVPALVGALRHRELALVSVFGTWILHSFWERAVVPAVGWFIRGAVNLDRVNDPGSPDAFANGQVICVDGDSYSHVGGHGAVRDQVLDDVRLAEAFKRRGLGIGLFAAPWLFRVRLYRSLRDIVNGYTKNLYEGMGRRPQVGLGAVLFIFVGTLIPYLALALGLLARLWWGWNVPGSGTLLWLTALCALQVLFRWRIERRDGRSGWAAWTHPLANLVLVWILLASVLGLRSRWKGREFRDGRAAG